MPKLQKIKPLILLLAVSAILVSLGIWYLKNKTPSFKKSGDEFHFVAEAEDYKYKVGHKESNKPLVELQGKNDTSLSFQLLDSGAESKEPIKKGNKVIFENILENVDLVYTTLKNGLKEEIILHKNVNMSEFTFSLNVTNLQNEFVGNENLGGYFLDPSNDLGLYFEPPFAIDDAGNRTDEVKLQVYKSNQENVYTMKLRVNEEWLSSEERVYPITIDPTVIFSGYEEIEDAGINRGEINSSNEVDTKYKSLEADEYTVGLWHLNETTGTVVTDSSGLSNTLTATNTESTDWTTGIIGNGIDLDGSNEYLTKTYDADFDFATGSFTVEAWFTHPTISAIDYLISRYDADQGWKIYMDASGDMCFGIDDDATWGPDNSACSSAIDYDDDNWHHVAAVKDRASHIILYVDGVEITRTAITATATLTSNSAELNIGSDAPTEGSYWDGMVDEIRISKVARTAEEIKQAATKYPYAVYTSPVLDAGEEITSWGDLSWTENGVATGDGETVYDSTGLVAQWNFNETSGTTANNDAEGTSCGGTPANCDGSLSGFDSTASQDADPDSSWTANNRRWGAGALKFDGVDSHVSVSDNNSLDFGTGEFTISTWMKTSTTVSATVIGKHVVGGNTAGWDIRVNEYGTNKASFSFQQNSDSEPHQARAVSKTTVNDGNWHHVVGVRSGNTAQIYVDGKLEASDTSSDTPNVDNITDLIFGRRNTTYFNGILDTTQIYSRALSADEVASLYNSSNIEFQVRSGPTSTPDDSWDEWKPTGTETSIEDFEDQYLYDTSDANLVSYWPMDETADNLCSGGEDACDVDGTNHGTDSGGSKIVGGVFANARGFDGTDDYLDLGDDTSILSNNAGSISFWAKHGNSASKQSTVFGYGGDSTDQTFFIYLENNAGGTSFDVGLYTEIPTANKNQFTTDNSFSTGKWHHIVVASSGSAYTVYVDGVAQPITMSQGSNDGEWIGDISGGNNDLASIGARKYEGTVGIYYEGEIDELRFTNDVLTASEVFTESQKATTNPTTLHPKTESTILQQGSYSHKYELGQTQLDKYTLALYRLNETNGDNAGVDIFDATSNSFDLEIAGTNLASSVVGGIVDKGRDFNGTDDIASCTDASCGGASGFDTGSNDLTVSAWIKTTQTAAGTIASKMNSGGVDGWGLTVEAAGTAKLYSYAGTNFGRRSSAAIINDGKWHHIVGVYDNAGTITMYVDGVVSQGTLTGTVPTSIDDSDADFSIGFGLAGLGYFDGSIDEVKIDKIARTAEEIAEAYRMGRDHYLNKTVSATDLSDDSKVYFDIAADKPGTYLEATLGEYSTDNLLTATDMKGIFKLEELADKDSSAYINDSSGNASNLTDVSNPTVVTGKYGLARNFDGTADYLCSDPDNDGACEYDADLAPTTSFSVGAWFNPETFAATNPMIVARWDSFYILYDATAHCGGGAADKIAFIHYWTGYGCAIASETIPTGKWTHVVGVFDDTNNTVKIYINGILSATTAETDQLNDNASGYFYVGGVSAAYMFDGTIDEVFLTNDVLSDSEIKSMYERDTRTHPITIDFAAGLENDLITGSGDLSFEIDARDFGLPQKGSNLYVDEKVIVRETVDDTEYVAQGTVKSVQISNGKVWVNSWDTGSTFPTGGFTTNATVFKWQREYFDLSGIALDSFKDAITNVTFRVTNGNEGRTVYIDNLGATTGYLTTASSSSITSATGNRYYQYRAILTSSDDGVSASFSNVNIDYNTKSPEASWKFDENYGSTAYDHGGGGNNGTIAGATWTQSSECLSNNCLYFDGTNDTVQIADTDNLDFAADETFSFGGWFRTGAAEADVLIAKKNTQTSTDAGYMIHITDTGTLRCYASDGTNQTAAASDATFQDNKWHHVMCVNDDTNLILYVDGNPVKTTALTATGSYANALPLVMGEQGSGTADYTGYLDEMKVYRYARTEAEVKQEFAARASVAGASASFSPNDSDFLSDGLVGYWRLNESSGTAADSSGNGLTLTNNGTTTYSTGKFGNGSEHVPASSQYLSAGSTISGVKSVSFWVNPDSTTNYYIDLDGSAYVTSSSGTLSATGFTDATIYVNGVQSTTIAADTWSLVTVTTDTEISASAFRIGRVGSDYFDGTMDEVRFYNKKLSPNEINRLYNWAPGPLAYWNFDENSIDDIYMNNATTATSTTFSHTVHSGENQLLIVTASIKNSQNTWYSSAMTYNGDSLTLLHRDQRAASGRATTEIWYLKNPDQGSANVVVTQNEAHAVVYTARTLNGVDLTDTFGTVGGTNNTASSSITVTGIVTRRGDWLVDVLQHDGSCSATPVKNYADQERDTTYTTSGSAAGGLATHQSLTAATTSTGYSSLNATAGCSNSMSYAVVQKNNTDVVKDISGSGLSGTVEGGVLSQDIVQGKFGSAMEFTDSTTYVDMGDVSSTIGSNTEGTVSLWMKKDIGTSTGTPLYYGDSGTDDNVFRLTIGDATTIRAQLKTGVQVYRADATYPDDGKWHHISFTVNSSGNTFYIDGVKQSPTYVDGSASNTEWFDDLSNEDKLTFGSARVVSPTYFAGVIDEARIYNYARTPSQIIQDMNGGHPIGGSPVASQILRYKFDEGNQSTAYNTSSLARTDTPNTTSLEHWFTLDEASGNRTDAHTSYTLTDTNTVGSATGKQDNAALFVRTNSEALVGADQASVSFGNEDFTVGGWVNLTTASNWEALFGKWDEAANLREWNVIYNSASQRFSFQISSTGSGSSSVKADQLGLPSAGTWYFVVAWHDATANTINIQVNNGTADSAAYSNGSADRASRFVMGAQDDGTGLKNYSDSTIDEVFIYRRVLTDEERSWLYNNGSGQTYTNLSNIDVTGTISGATWKTGSDCKINSCLDFDGTNDVVTTTNAPAIDFDTGLSSGVTFTTWLNADTDGENDVGEIFQKGTNTYCRTSSESGGLLDLTCSLDLATSDATVTITDGLSTNTWHHVSMVYEDDSDDEIEVYIDGVLRGTSTNGSGSPASGDTNNLLIGGSSAANFDGSIDEFHIYSIPLTADEVKIDYNANSQASLGGVLGSSERTYVIDGAGANPVAWWKFDENKGTASIYDSSGNSYTGTMNGTMTEADWVSGKFGSALELDGSDDDISLAANSPLFKNLGEFSISSWIYLNSATAENTVIQSSIDGFVNQARLDFRTTTTGEMLCAARAPDAGSASAVTTTTSALTASRWYHVACAVDVANDTIKVYVDGVLMATTGTVAFTSTATDNTNPDSILIGQDTNGGQNMNGRIDELKIWEYELTQAQVAYEYNRGGPVGWWKLDDCTGTTAYDGSDKGNNLTLSIGGTGTNTSAGTCSGSAGEAWFDGASGKFGSSLEFDGTDDYAYCTDAACGGTTKLDFSTANNLSFSAWIKTETTGTQMTIMGKKLSTATSRAGYRMGTATNGSIKCTVSDGTNQAEPTATINTTDGSWHHVTCVVDGTNTYTYIDGNLDSSATVGSVTGNLDNTEDFKIGDQGNGSGKFTGQIDDVRVYNYALSAAQIRNIMNLGAQSFR